jgi:uncharacterized protein
MTTRNRMSMALPFWLACAVLFAAGCGKSAPTRYYTLSSLAANGQQAGDPAQPPAGPGPDKGSLVLGVGPVEAPAYLERSQIVSRLGANRMHVSEFDQWVETLPETFKRVLAEDIGKSAGAASVVLLPWSGAAGVDRQVQVQLRQFDGVLGGEAVLRADWIILDAKGELLARGTADLREPVAGPDYTALAAAYSNLVARLGQDIARALVSPKRD